MLSNVLIAYHSHCWRERQTDVTSRHATVTYETPATAATTTATTGATTAAAGAGAALHIASV